MNDILGMKTKTLVALLALSCAVVVGEDEDETLNADFEETKKVANALSNAKGVTYKVDNKTILTDKGLVYRLNRNTYVGPDGIYTRLGKDWVTPSGFASGCGRGDYSGQSGGPSVRSGNGWVKGDSYNYTGR